MAATDTFHASRVATGDWVVLRRADQGPLGFLGKVSDGEWDPRDDALLRARVDTTSSKAAWFAVGDLERVEPADEAGLVEAALLEGLVPADRPDGRAERLRADVASLRAGALTFVRSPGLLDRLWAALPTDPAQRSGGLAAFFDEGRRALLDVREKRWAPPAAPVETASAATPARSGSRAPVLPDDFEIVDVLDPEPHERPVAPTRPTSRREAVERLLNGIPRWSLPGTMERLRRSDLVGVPAVRLRESLLAEGLTLQQLLRAFSPYMMREAPPLLGLPDVPRLANRTVEAWILGTFSHLPETPADAPPPPAVVGALPPLPAWAPPVTPASEAEATWRVLGLVRGRELAGVCERFGEPAFALLGSARHVALALARSGKGLRRLLPALPLRALQVAPWALGLELRGSDEVILAEFLRRFPPTTWPAPSPGPEPEDRLLPHVLRALTLAELTLVLLGFRSQAPVDPALLIPILRGEGRDTRDLLAHLGPGALRRVATAVGVPESVDGPERLHAAILSLAPSPFA